MTFRNQMIQKIDLNTRNILHKVHLNRIKNKKGLKRVSNYISTKTLKVKRIFLKEKFVENLVLVAMAVVALMF